MAEKRSKLIVNRDLQLREAAGSAAIVIISINLLLIISSVSPGFIRISVNLPATGYLLVALAELVILGIVVTLSIRRSHRIAGPMHAITRDLRRMGDGDLTVQVKLRPRDEFLEEAKIINDAIESVRLRVQAIKNNFTKMVDAQEQSERNRIAEILASELEQLQTDEKSAEGNDDG